jgi:hypothetical protein
LSSSGLCVDGGTHDHTGSGNYLLTQNRNTTDYQQNNWRYCSKCQCLAYAGMPSGPGPCAGGGTHTQSGSGDYVFGQVLASVTFTTTSTTTAGTSKGVGV